MKRIFFLVVLIASIMNSSAQKAKEQFDYAVELYNNNKYDSALYLFASVYNKTRVNATLAAKSYYNIGQIYLEKKNYPEARKVFENILVSDYDEMDRGGTGSGLMAEPYALYKNRCCRILAHLAFDEKQFSKALEYTEMSDTEYPYYHFCGNELAASAIYTALMYAKCYEGLNEPDKAIAKLLSECCDIDYAENDDVVQMATRLIKSKYATIEIKKEIESASEKITFEKVGQGNNSYEVYYTTIFQSKFNLRVYRSNITYEEIKDLKDISLYRYLFTHCKFITGLLKN